nr:MAG TPA: hypothetical protein [Caudoviricetes sp.]
MVLQRTPQNLSGFGVDNGRHQLRHITGMKSGLHVRGIEGQTVLIEYDSKQHSNNLFSECLQCATLLSACT